MNVSRPPGNVVRAVTAACPTCWPFFVQSIRNLRVPGSSVELTSWYRTPDHNERVGGSPTSQHLVGTALDLSGPGARDIAAQLRNAGWTWVPEGDHEHVQVFDRNPFNLGRVV